MTFDCRSLTQTFQGRSGQSSAKLNLDPTDDYTTLYQAPVSRT